jgi:hypothetical protein
MHKVVESLFGSITMINDDSKYFLSHDECLRMLVKDPWMQMASLNQLDCPQYETATKRANFNEIDRKFAIDQPLTMQPETTTYEPFEGINKTGSRTESLLNRTRCTGSKSASTQSSSRSLSLEDHSELFNDVSSNYSTPFTKIAIQRVRGTRRMRAGDTHATYESFLGRKHSQGSSSNMARSAKRTSTMQAVPVILLETLHQNAGFIESAEEIEYNASAQTMC